MECLPDSSLRLDLLVLALPMSDSCKEHPTHAYGDAFLASSRRPERCLADFVTVTKQVCQVQLPPSRFHVRTPVHPLSHLVPAVWPLPGSRHYISKQPLQPQSVFAQINLLLRLALLIRRAVVVLVDRASTVMRYQRILHCNACRLLAMSKQGQAKSGMICFDARMATKIAVAGKVVPFNDFLTFLDEWWQTADGADTSSVKIYAHPVALVQEWLSCCCFATKRRCLGCDAGPLC